MLSNFRKIIYFLMLPYSLLGDGGKKQPAFLEAGCCIISFLIYYHAPPPAEVIIMTTTIIIEAETLMTLFILLFNMRMYVL